MNVVILAALVLHLTGLWSYLTPSMKLRLGEVTTPAPATLVAPLPAQPVKSELPTTITPEVGSSMYAVDVTTGQELFAAGAATPRPIASITKLMTVMVALSKLKPTDIVTVGTLPTYQVEDETLGLIPGQKISVQALVTAALIPSDNDAADALGIATSGDLPKFYAAMNQRAAEWGITGAHFVSASGLIDTGNLVSAQAVAKIARLDLTSPLVKTLVNTKTATIRDEAGKNYSLKTTNDLLATGDFYGIKTGYTQASGECFVGLTTIDGHDVITVVLGTSDRFGQTQMLVNWIGTNYTWL